MNKVNCNQVAQVARELAAEIRAGVLNPGKMRFFRDNVPVCTLGHLYHRTLGVTNVSCVDQELSKFLGVSGDLPSSLRIALDRVFRENDAYPREDKILCLALDTLATTAEAL